MALLESKDILREFHEILVSRLKGEKISACPIDVSPDGTLPKFQVGVSVPDILDQDLDESITTFKKKHLQQLADDIASNLLGYLRACPGCELLLFPLPLPGGMAWSEKIYSSNLAVRLVRGYSIDDNRYWTRFDIVFGIRATVPVAVEVAA